VAETLQGEKQSAPSSWRRRGRGRGDNPGDLPGYLSIDASGSQDSKFMCRVASLCLCVYCCVGREKQRRSSKLACRRAKGVMGCGSCPRCTAHRQGRKRPAVALLCSSVLCCAAMCYANDQSGRSALECTASKVPLAGVWPGQATPGILLSSPDWS